MTTGFYQTIRGLVYAAMVFAMLVPSVYAANISANIDRKTVGIDESFQLTFTADEEVPNPDFSPLIQDFEILDQSRNQQISMINGTTTSRYEWQVVLMPTKPGTFQIPAIRFGQDQSQPLSVRVRPVKGARATNDQVFLEVDVDSKNPYVQQQIIYTVRLYRSVQVRSMTLTEPEVRGAEVISERLGQDTEFESNRGGRQFLVVERKYSIFPQQSGALEIKPLVFKGQVVTRNTSNNFNIFNQATTRPVRIRSNAIILDVRPIPTQITGAWLPAKAFQLTESWPEKELKVGEPITRAISMRALGLTAAQLPELQANYPVSLKHYTEPPQLETESNSDGVVGSRVDRAAIVPTAAGQMTLAEIKVNWWNIDKDRLEVATIPPRTIDVMVAPIAQPNPALLDAASSSVTSGPDFDVKNPPGWWPWISVALTCAWLLTMGMWWYDRHRTTPTKSSTSVIPPDTKTALKNLNAACGGGDIDAVRDSLLEWGTALWPEFHIRNLGDLANQCEGTLREHILRVEKTLYGTAAETWDGTALYKSARDFKPTVPQRKVTKGVTLEPLYRH